MLGFYVGIRSLLKYLELKKIIVSAIPEQACGGSGKIRVVELFLLATAQPSDCGLKLRNCCIKSEHSMRATSAKCKSQRIWFLNRRALFWFGPVKLRPHELHLRHSS